MSGTPKGRVFPTSRDDLVECAALVRTVRHGELDAIVCHDAPLDVLAQQIVAETSVARTNEDDLFALVTRAWPYRTLSRPEFDAVVRMVAEGFDTRRGRRAALVHRDEVHHVVRGRRGARLLAQTSGGAIPEVADYRVVLDPDDTFIGTVNEDFAIESMGGDVFQLGNASWRVLQVLPGTVRVADAKGFRRTSHSGSAKHRREAMSCRARLAIFAPRSTRCFDHPAGYGRMADTAKPVCPQAPSNRSSTTSPRDAARSASSRRKQTLVLERFFDESGGMQLVLHAPFGSRINKAWGLALRKRFCRQFNFELQAAATDDAVLLSLGPQHSFPLADVFRYLHPNIDSRRARSSVSRRAGVPDTVALEHDHLARRSAQLAAAGRCRRSCSGCWPTT